MAGDEGGERAARLTTIRSAFGRGDDATDGLGTNMVAPHFLHLPLLPAFSSPTENDLPHFVQEKVIITTSKPYCK